MNLVKHISLFFCVMILGSGYCKDIGSYTRGDITNLLTIAELNSYFSSMRIDNETLRLTFHNQGMRYKYTIDNKSPTISNYGESIKLSINQSLKMVSRGVVLEFEGSSNNNKQGFAITQKIDLRSIGGAVNTKRSLLVLKKDGKFIGPSLTLEPLEELEAPSN